MLRTFATRIMSAAPARVPIPKNGVDYRGKVVLAPMVRSGELPSRLMALKYGADLVWGPETVDRAIIGCQVRHNPRTSTVEFTRVPSNRTNDTSPRESIIYRIHPALESSKLIFQIGTADPTLATEAATLVAPYVAGIDVNAGCPKPFSTSGGMGAALLSTPDLLCAILRALVADVGARFELGISVKIRLLPDPADTEALVRALCATGITGLTIHCRTRTMRKTERAVREQLRMVGEICREAGVACLMNGDVEDRAQALALAAEHGVDGAMIATAAEKNPSVFRPDGPIGWQEPVAAYMAAALDVENRWGNTKFLLAQMVPGKEQARRGISQAKNYEHTCAMLELPELAAKARELDAMLNMTDRTTKSEQKAQKAQNQKSSERKRQERQDRSAAKRQKHSHIFGLPTGEMGPESSTEQSTVPNNAEPGHGTVAPTPSAVSV